MPVITDVVEIDTEDDDAAAAAVLVVSIFDIFEVVEHSSFAVFDFLSFASDVLVAASFRFDTIVGSDISCSSSSS